MKIKSSIKYTFGECTPTIIPIMIAFAALILIGVVISVFFEGTAYFGNFETTGIGFAFVMGIILYKGTLEMSVQNGISRRTAFIGRVGATVIFTFIIAGLLRLFYAIGALFSTFIPNLYFDGMFEEIYSGFVGKTNIVLSFFSGWIFYAFALMMFMFIGMFIGNAYYAMNKFVKLIVSIGVPVFLVVGIPAILQLTGRFDLVLSFASFLSKMFGFTSQNPFMAIIPCVIISAVLMFFSYLMSRRATIK